MSDSAAVLLGCVLLGALVLWPAFEAWQRDRIGWVVGIVILAPLGGALWFLTGQRRREPSKVRSGPAL